MTTTFDPDGLPYAVPFGHQSSPFDPRTGEVVDLQTVAKLYVAVTLAEADAVAEAERLGEERRVLADQLRDHIPVEGRADAGAHWVSVVPGKPGRRLVSREACEAYKEQLLDIGLGRMETRYVAPTVSVVDGARAELTAAGVPYSTIIPPPPVAPAEVVVVPKGAK